MRKIIIFVFVGILVLSSTVTNVHANYTSNTGLPSQIILCGVFPISTRPDAGPDRRDGFLMAIDEINAQTGSDKILPDGVNLVGIVKDDLNTAAGGTAAAQSCISDGADLVIGSSGSTVSAAMAAVLTPNNIIQISYASSSPALSDRTQYPYFMRVVSSDADQAYALADLINALGFTNGSTINTDDSYGMGLVSYFTTNYTSTTTNTIISAQTFAPGTTDVSAQVQALKDANPQFVLLHAIDADAKTVLKQAYSLGITGTSSNIAWVITDGSTSIYTFTGDSNVQTAMQHIVGTRPTAIVTSNYYQFNVSWWTVTSCGTQTPCGASRTDLNPNSYAPFAYDAVFVAAKGIAAAGTVDHSQANTDLLLQKLYAVTFTGVSGVVKFNSKGEVNGKFDYVTLNGDTFTTFGSWSGTATYITDHITLTNGITYSLSVTTTSTQITLCGVFPISTRPEAGPDRRDAFLMAIDQINAQTGSDRILPVDVTLKGIIKDDFNTASGGISAAKSCIIDGADLVIGSSGSTVSEAMANVLTTSNIIQISYASSSPVLSDRTQYPYFMRVVGTDADQAYALTDLINAIGFTKGATITTDDSYGFGLISYFKSRFVNSTIKTLVSNQTFGPGDADVSVQLQAIKDANPQFVLLHAIDADTKTVLKTAYNIGLTGTSSDIVWIITDGATSTTIFAGDNNLQSIMQDFVGTRGSNKPTSNFNQFNTYWWTVSSCGTQDPCGASRTNAIFDTYAPFAYDAVYVAAKGIATVGGAVTHTQTDTNILLKALYNVSFTGASGMIKFNSRGEINSKYEYVRLINDKFTIFGEWNGNPVFSLQKVILSNGQLYSLDGTPISATTIISTTPPSSQKTVTTTAFPNLIYILFLPSILLIGKKRILKKKK